MSFDLTKHNAEMVVADAPLEWLQLLLPWDGVSKKSGAYSKDFPPAPKSFFALGLMGGAAGSHVSGWDALEWLTPLGQAVVDKIKS